MTSGTRGPDRRLAEFLRQSPRMARWTFENFPADDPVGASALAAARAYVANEDGEFDGENVYIWGGVGSGKTSLAWSMARESLDEMPYDEIAFRNVRQWLAEVRASFNASETVDPMYVVRHAGLLVLDDIGAERPTDWARETLATLVEHRYEERMTTIVTSNYAPHELIRRLGHDDLIIGRRIVSRLVEDALQIPLDRPDLRAGAAA